MNRERVQMLRDMLSGIPEKQIELDDYYTANGEACNTIACIAGWAAIYPPFVAQGLRAGMDRTYFGNEFKTPTFERSKGMHAAARFFGVKKETFLYQRCSESGSQKEIALRRLDKLLAK